MAVPPNSHVPDDDDFPAAIPGGAPLFVVGYADDEYPFWDETRMRFGRDDQACQIPVWEELNRRSLSKVAGELWCHRGQMWVRNLSTVHELVVTGPRGSQILPAGFRGPGQDRRTLRRINTLLQDITRNGNDGVGKPEPLRHGFQGYWSRRISDEQRLIYRIANDEVRIAACRYHCEG